MLTNEEIRARFECSADMAERLFDLQATGYAHGLAGYYQDGDYSSDADWCYGTGEAIAIAETMLEIDDNSLFDLYTEAHGEGLEAFEKAKPALPQYTSLGGYTILYTRDNECFCAKCARTTDHAATYDEGDPIECDECGAEIESSYGPVTDPVFRVLLDVSPLGNGAAWEAWCDGSTAELRADGIEPQGMADAFEAWDVMGVASEEAARERVARYLTDGVTVHSVSER